MMMGMDQPLAAADGRDMGVLHVPHGYPTGPLQPGPPGSYHGGMPQRPGYMMSMGGSLPGWDGLPSYPHPAYQPQPQPLQTIASISPESNGNPNDGTKCNWFADTAPVSPPPQRERFSYTRYQLELMNGIYIHIRYPNSMQKQLIAKRVGITRDQVKIWFQNKRRKEVVAKHDPSKSGSQGGGYANPLVEGESPIKMVPDGVLTGVVKELLKYENDPKGKKVLKAIEASQKAAAAKKKIIREEKKIPEEASQIPNVPSRVSPVTPNTEHANISAIPNHPTTSSFRSPESSECSLSLDQNTSIRSAHSLSFSSPESHTPDSHSMITSEEAVATAKMLLSKPANVPTSDELDMVAPPNTVVPNCNSGMPRKRSRSVESLTEDQDLEEESSPKQIKVDVEKQEQPPPNKVAPPSAPIKFKRPVVSEVNLTPLSVTIPGQTNSIPFSTQAIKTSAFNSLPVHSPQNSLLGINYGHLWNAMPAPNVVTPKHLPAAQYDDLTPFTRDNGLPSMSNPDQRSGQNSSVIPPCRPSAREETATRPSEPFTPSWTQGQSLPDPHRFGVPQSDIDPCKVFPFPIMAEPSRLLSSMNSYHDAYAPQSMSYLDTYGSQAHQQPAVITSYPNPYYSYDAGLWSNNLDKSKHS